MAPTHPPNLVGGNHFRGGPMLGLRLLGVRPSSGAVASRGLKVVAGVLALHVATSVMGTIMTNITVNASGCGSVAVIAHRGEPSRAPEETIPSFTQAINDGVRSIEMDVRFTSDHVPVLMHDATVDRTTDGTGRVTHLSLDQLEQLDAGAWFGPTYAGTRVPTFAEALQLAQDRGVSVVAELKAPATLPNVQTFDETIRTSGVPVVVESKDPYLLQAIEAIAPSIPRALITDQPLSAAKIHQTAQIVIAADAVSTTANVKKWHAAKIVVWTWTPNLVQEWTTLRKAKVDAVVTDDTHAFFASCSRVSFTAPKH